MATYKVVLVGEGGVGKSTFAHRFLTGEFEKKYVPTLGVEVHPLTFQTAEGPICFNIWDCAGQEKFGGLRDGYYINGQCAIVMYDLTSKKTAKRVPYWIDQVRRVCGNEIPIVVVGNKEDVDEFKYDLPTTEMSYLVSSKSNFEIEQPFLYLARQLSKNPHLEFLPSPAIEPGWEETPVPLTA